MSASASDSRDLFSIGAARREIRVPVRGVTMLGWGDNEHVARGAATPLYARAIAISAPNGKRVVMLCLETGFVTEVLRAEIRKRTGLAREELILSATHTHSAPGGFAADVLYALSVGGFIPTVAEAYVAAGVEAVRAALEGLAPGRIRFAAGTFSDESPVAFNRSLRAWRRNPEAKEWPRKVGAFDTDLAVDREMTLLRFEDAAGRPIAAWNWFPVHATSMHRDHYLVHSDNKGLAAVATEEAIAREIGGENQDFVAVFAQGAAGDVSPNFRRHVGIREMRGAFRDDERSCRYNAEIQSRKALEIFAAAARAPALEAKLDAVLEYHDFSGIEVDPRFVGGRKELRTGPAEVGLPQLYGTAEGRGAPLPMIRAIAIVVWACRIYNAIVDRLGGRATRWPWTDDPVQGRKLNVVGAGVREIFETGRITRLVFPGAIHPVIGALKKWAKNPALRERPFTPQVLPVQLVRLGHLAIAGVPAEFTTVAGMRLRKMLEAELRATGTERVVIQGYANGFSSYVTTPEEYVAQKYEGGCTLFGRWTLPAYLTVFHQMLERFLAGKPATKLAAPEPSPEFWRAITSEMVVERGESVEPSQKRA
ncbi:MAG: neutral/alkaline non-lysosomal ceramidase N-terminal domain-containing protein [Bdellovibrionales bacterium]|nr:neutral/alkaline non-lysosomal ceramidase N-terminal domain-containing protein [Bdellovibrionales bacterium]